MTRDTENWNCYSWIHRARHHDLTPEQESVPFVSRGNRSFPVEPRRTATPEELFNGVLANCGYSIDRFCDPPTGELILWPSVSLEISTIYPRATRFTSFPISIRFLSNVPRRAKIILVEENYWRGTFFLFLSFSRWDVKFTIFVSRFALHLAMLELVVWKLQKKFSKENIRILENFRAIYMYIPAKSRNLNLQSLWDI